MTCKAIIKEKLKWFDYDKHFNWSNFIKQALTKCKYIPTLK
jgi:hypothetical protein